MMQEKDVQKKVGLPSAARQKLEMELRIGGYPNSKTVGLFSSVTDRFFVSSVKCAFFMVNIMQNTDRLRATLRAKEIYYLCIKASS